MSAEKLKADAARLAEHLSTKFGYKLKPSAALEALAISRGFRDWNSCLAASLAQQPQGGHATSSPSLPPPFKPQKPLVADAMRRLGHTHAAAWLNAVAFGGPGIYLVAGGVGSGRSTTFRAMADDLSECEKHTVLLSELGQPGKSMFEVSGAAGVEFRQAMRAAPDIILVPEGVRDQEFAVQLLDGVQMGFTVVASLHGTSVQAVYRRMTALCGNQETLDRCLSGVLVQRLLRRRGEDGLLTEMALFQDEARFPTAELPPAWPTLLDDAMSKCDKGRLSPYAVIEEFGEEAVARFKPGALKTEDVRRALAAR